MPPAGNDVLCQLAPEPGVPCPVEPLPPAGSSEFRRLPCATKSLVNGCAALGACGQKYCIRPKGCLRTQATYIFSTEGVGYLVSPLQNGHESTSGKAYTILFQASIEVRLQTLMGYSEMAPREPPSDDSLVAAYMVGRHFAESMRIPMQESSDVILRCTPFSPEIPRTQLGYLHAGVCVVNNAWTDDVGEEAMELLVEAMAEAGVQPPTPPRSHDT